MFICMNIICILALHFFQNILNEKKYKSVFIAGNKGKGY